MEYVFFLFAIICAVAFLVRDYRARKALTQIRQESREQIDALKRQIADRQQEDERLQRLGRENDLSDPQNQLRFVRECGLRAVSPVNREAVRVLYAIDEWLKKHQPDWRFGFEVAMGSFIQTSFDVSEYHRKKAFSSYSGKRVDFLLIDRYGHPVLAVEYNGSGHNLSDDADARMAVKSLALEKASIPLLEIPEGMDKAEIFTALSQQLGQCEA